MSRVEYLNVYPSFAISKRSFGSKSRSEPWENVCSAAAASTSTIESCSSNPNLHVEHGDTLPPLVEVEGGFSDDDKACIPRAFLCMSNTQTDGATTYLEGHSSTHTLLGCCGCSWDEGRVDREADGTCPEQLSHEWDCAMLSTNSDTVVREREDMPSDNEHLRSLSRDRCNIVIDPPNPAAAPYIVITPPPHDSQWADYHAWYHNTITPQWIEYLVVPQVSLGVASIHPLRCATPTQDIELIPPPSTTGDSSSMRHVYPPTIFNHSANWTYSKHPDERKEKLTLTLYRHCYKSSAYSAAHRARIFTTNPSITLISLLKHKPLVWSDPADPFLTDVRRFCGVTVLESLTPCTVPHIVITDEPPATPWIAWANTTLQQDSEGGNWLTVPPWHYGPGLLPDSGQADIGRVMTNETPVKSSLDIIAEEPELEEDKQSISRAETPIPLTPLTLACAGEDLLLDSGDNCPLYAEQDTIDIRLPNCASNLAFHEHVRDLDQTGYPDYHVILPVSDEFVQTGGIFESYDSSKEVVRLKPPQPPDPEPRVKREFYEDDEDLPPLDDWYLSIAQRTNITLFSY